MYMQKDQIMQYQSPEAVNDEDSEKLKQAINSKRKYPVFSEYDNIKATDILSSILPPRIWSHDGKHYVQYVSHSPSSRDDVAGLQKLLDERLLARQARESGLDPIRQELHSQCFDELIRQVAIDCPERGLLLMRVRDELKMTVAAYENMYRSSVAMSMKKMIEAEQIRNELESQANFLEEQKAELKKKVYELTNKILAMQKRNAEKRAELEARRSSELEFLRLQQTHLEQFVSSLQLQPETK